MKNPINDILDLPDTPEMHDAIFEALQNAKPVTSDRSVTDTTEEDPIGGLPPLLPVDLIDRLPSPLSAGARHMKTDEERSVFVTAALPVIAGAMLNVRVRHSDGLVDIGLYTATFAPAGSGKGALRYAHRLGKEIDRHLYDASVLAQQRHKDEGEDGEPPPFRSLFLSANTSGRAVVDNLSANGERGVICESELLTAIQTSKQDWGQYRDVLLKAAHGEPITLDRAKGERVRISSPSLSFTVTGTLSALPRFFQSQEDGLFSRFSFLTFEGSAEWRTQRPRDEEGDVLSDVLDNLALDLQRLYIILAKRSTPLIVDLAPESWDRHFQHFKELHDTRWVGNAPFSASVKRAGLTTVRVSAILAVLRGFEEERIDLTTVERITVEERDFEAAIELVTLWLHHALYLSRMLPDTAAAPRTSSGRRLSEEQRRFLNELTKLDEFGLTEAIELAENIGIGVSKRTIETWLGGALPGVKRVKRGRYQATSPSQ